LIDFLVEGWEWYGLNLKWPPDHGIIFGACLPTSSVSLYFMHNEPCARSMTLCTPLDGSPRIAKRVIVTGRYVDYVAFIIIRYIAIQPKNREI
jgi:hypothetical protein